MYLHLLARIHPLIMPPDDKPNKISTASSIGLWSAKADPALSGKSIRSAFYGKLRAYGISRRTANAQAEQYLFGVRMPLCWFS